MYNVLVTIMHDTICTEKHEDINKYHIIAFHIHSGTAMFYVLQIAEAEKKTSECGPIARVTQAASVSLLCLCRGTRGQAAPFWRVPGAALNSVPGVITGRATLATNC